jgi:hypothetical protein
VNKAQARPCRVAGERCHDTQQCCPGLLCGNWNDNTRGRQFCL